MTMQGVRVVSFMTVLIGMTSGCTAVPPAPAAGPQAGTQPGKSGVVLASAEEPIEPAAAPVQDEGDGFDLEDLSPTNLTRDFKEALGLGPDENIARAALAEGENHFKEKDYDAAVDALKTAAARWPDSILEEDAMFLLAESYFFADRYGKAQDAYSNLLKKYDNSRHLDTVCRRLFSIGQYWERLHQRQQQWAITPNLTDKTQPLFDTFGNALKCYDLIRLEDPTGPLADDSIMATAQAHFLKGQYTDAAFYFDVLRRDYPDSEHQAKAHLLCLQAKLRSYQGPTYDATPLAEADKVAEQALRQFPGQLGDERQRVEKARGQILREKADRDWAVAEFYEGKSCYRAARIYYESIIQDYPGSPHAERARTRLEAIRGKPDVPPNHYRWLTDLFPGEGEKL